MGTLTWCASTASRWLRAARQDRVGGAAGLLDRAEQVHMEANAGKELQKSSKTSRSQMSKNFGGGELHTTRGRLQRSRRSYGQGLHLPHQRRARRRLEAATISDTKRSLRLLNGAQLRAIGRRIHEGERKTIPV